MVDITELPAWLVWQSDGFQRIVARLAASGLPAGAFESDPRVTAPDTLSEVRHALDLPTDAATLYLQMLTLAEPTRARLQRVNGWKKGEVEAARTELLERGLLEEARFDGSSRQTFVPGEVAFPAPPASTLEAAKLPLYGLEKDSKGRLRAPFGVVLPLRPLPELFAEAWHAAAAR